MMTLKPLLACFLFAASGATFAKAPDCMDSATTQLDMNACAASKSAKSDAQLNRTYRDLLGRLDAPSAAKLKEAQRRWAAWRDAQCAFEVSGASGGSIAPMVQAQCVDRLTQAQTRLLDKHLHCEEGDTSCAK